MQYLIQYKDEQRFYYPKDNDPKMKQQYSNPRILPAKEILYLCYAVKQAVVISYKD